MFYVLLVWLIFVGDVLEYLLGRFDASLATQTQLVDMKVLNTLQRSVLLLVF